MNSSADIKEIQEKFSTVQNIVKGLSEEKIKVETEIKTLNESMQNNLEKLMNMTGTSSFEEAMKYYEDNKAKLENDIQDISKKLTEYLDTYGEEENV